MRRRAAITVCFHRAIDLRMDAAKNRVVHTRRQVYANLETAPFQFVIGRWQSNKLV